MNDKDFLSSVSYVDNINQTVIDPFLTDLGKVTLNKDYYPNKYISTRVWNLDNSRIEEQGYLPCSIKVYYGGTEAYTIPILFQQSFSESNSASYAKESPVGSTYPIIAFSNSEPSAVNFSFVALSDYLPSGYTSLKEYIDDIKKMTKPKYSGNIVLSPSVKITFSNLTYTGVCDSVNVDYHNVFNNKSLVKADITCAFTLTEGV